MNKVVYVGLDVHADTIAVAVADEGRLGETGFSARSRIRLSLCCGLPSA